MNAIHEPAAMLPDQRDQSPAESFTLRRTGRKAVRFDGWHLVEAIGSNGSRPVWHDLNVYRTTKDQFVVELTVRHSVPDMQDTVLVQCFGDLPAAAAWLEAYRPAADAPVPSGLAGNDVALPWAVLQAVQLRQTIDRLEADYRALLTEVFAALDLTDPPEVRQAA